MTPTGLSRIQLFSGGAEAVEAAFRLAKSVTKKFEFVGYSGAFHGKTGGVLPLLWGDFKDGLGPFVPGTYSAPYAYCYRCPLNLTYPDCGIACAEKTRDVIRNQTGGAVAAIIVEPMQGTAGNVIPPPGFLPAVRAIARGPRRALHRRRNDHGLRPHRQVLGRRPRRRRPRRHDRGKGIGGGFPLAAVVSTDELTRPEAVLESVAEARPPTAAIRSRRRRASPRSRSSSRRTWSRTPRASARAMLGQLQAMQEKHRIIGDVRGKGLLLGLELVKDRRTKELVSKDFTKALFQECLRRGLVAMVYSPVIRL